MTSTTRFFGCGTALATPFASDGSIDERALRSIVSWQIAERVHFLVPCGSTGEAATMTVAEHRRVVEIVVDETRGRVPVVAGAGSNDTRKAIALSEEMCAAGATHLLHVSPMYNKPPQRGIVAHFRAITDAVDLPVIVYNVPGRTGSNIEARTTLALAEIPSIIAVKEASGNLGQIMDIIRDRPEGFSVLSGDDSLTLPMLAIGARGVVSVVGNVAPRPMKDLLEAFEQARLVDAEALHKKLTPLMRALFLESNPAPAKSLLADMGICANELRLPLVPVEPRTAEAVRVAAAAAGVQLKVPVGARS